MRFIFALLLALAVVPLGACDENHSHRPMPQISGESSLDQSAFDLQTAIGLIRTSKVKDAQTLEQAVNDPASGINNVDIDADGQIDYVGVNEIQVAGSGRQFDFMACPSSKQGDPTKIAEVAIANDGQQFVVSGGYSSMFAGYDSTYYSYAVPRTSLGEALFLSWMLSPRPYYAYHPYGYGYASWAPRPVFGPTALHSTRTTYTTTTRIAPVAKQAPPSGYASKAAVKMPSGFGSRGSGSSLSSKASAMRGFGVGSGSKPAASSFGGGGGDLKPSWATSKPSSSLKPSWSSSKPSGSSSSLRPSWPSSKPSSSSWSSTKPSSSWGSRSSFGGSKSSFGGSSFGRSSSSRRR